MIEIKVVEDPDCKSFFRAGFQPVARMLSSGQIRPFERRIKRPIRYLFAVDRCVLAADRSS
jgi:hypothetical protein